MSEHTAIEWCDSTVNFWEGCTKVSPACDNCYAERKNRWLNRGENWGPGAPRRRFSTAAATVRSWQRNATKFRDKHARDRRVFVNSTSDWLDNEAPIEALVELLDSIRTSPDVTFLLLSKRIGNWRKRLEEAATHRLAAILANGTGPQHDALWQWIKAWLDDKPPANVWLGSTVVNQAEADRDIPKLLAVPARVRFLSIEPMLGAIDPTRWLDRCDHGSRPGPGGVGGVACAECDGNGHGCTRLHWVICGGESGPQARPMHPDWARSLRDQCKAAGVPFLFKQHGEWAPGSGFFSAALRTAAVARDGRVAEGGVRRDQYPPGATSADGWSMVHRAGKKSAGRLLDGRTHDDMPEVS